MKKETKETTPKDRIVVLEKGKNLKVSPLHPCCAAPLMPFRGW
jgi:hypothetical protein